MSHSKLYQELHAYRLEIDIKDTRCPVCHKKHLKMNTMGDVTCKCGYINSTGHMFVAGHHINNNLDFHINKIKLNDNKE